MLKNELLNMKVTCQKNDVLSLRNKCKRILRYEYVFNPNILPEMFRFLFKKVMLFVSNIFHLNTWGEHFNKSMLSIDDEIILLYFYRTYLGFSRTSKAER